MKNKLNALMIVGLLPLMTTINNAYNTKLKEFDVVDDLEEEVKDVSRSGFLAIVDLPKENQPFKKPLNCRDNAGKKLVLTMYSQSYLEDFAKQYGFKVDVVFNKIRGLAYIRKDDQPQDEPKVDIPEIVVNDSIVNDSNENPEAIDDQPQDEPKVEKKKKKA